MANETVVDRIKFVKSWIATERVKSSKAIVALSAERLAFFSINTERSGRFVDFLNLDFCTLQHLPPMLEKTLRHVEAIGLKYLKKPEMENGHASKIQNASNSIRNGLG